MYLHAVEGDTEIPPAPGMGARRLGWMSTGPDVGRLEQRAETEALSLKFSWTAGVLQHVRKRLGIRKRLGKTVLAQFVLSCGVEILIAPHSMSADFSAGGVQRFSHKAF